MGRKGNINNGRFALGLLFGSPLLFMPFPNLHCGAGRFGKGAEQLNQSCAGQEHNGDKQNQKNHNLGPDAAQQAEKAALGSREE